MIFRILMFLLAWIALAFLSILYWNKEIDRKGAWDVYSVMIGLAVFGPFTFLILYWHLKSLEIDDDDTLRNR